jgi:threonine dehydrogenase-like Zn-dependent dehydrogenase
LLSSGLPDFETIAAVHRHELIGSLVVGSGLMTVMDLREDRLVFTQDRLGADAVLRADTDAERKASVATAGDFFDVAIDCTGNQAAMQRGFGFVGARRALRTGQRGSSNVTFSDPEFHKRETTLFASRNAQPDDFADVLRQMQAGRVPTLVLHTHTGPLALARNDLRAGLL